MRLTVEKTVVAVAKNLGDLHTDLHRENMFPWTCAAVRKVWSHGLTAEKTVVAVAKNLGDFHTDLHRENMFPWTCLQFGRFGVMGLTAEKNGCCSGEKSR